MSKAHHMHRSIFHNEAHHLSQQIHANRNVNLMLFTSKNLLAWTTAQEWMTFEEKVQKQVLVSNQTD